MCGIVGITSNKPVSSAIINSLRKLEYRGYDSAGLATLSGGIINEVKSEGRVENLEKNIVEFFRRKSNQLKHQTSYRSACCKRRRFGRNSRCMTKDFPETEWIPQIQNQYFYFFKFLLVCWLFFLFWCSSCSPQCWFAARTRKCGK